MAAPALLHTLYRLLGTLPSSCHGPLATVLGSLLSLLPIRERKIAQLQMQRFLGESRPSIAKVYSHFARVLLESTQLQSILTHATFVCDNLPEIQSWRREERPLIALTAHLGNWDLLAAWFIAQGIPITTIGRTARRGAVQELLQEMRQSYGVKTLWRGADGGEKGVLRELLRDLSQGRVIAALLDQDTRVDSILVPFFGLEAKTPHSLVELGLRRKARFVSAFLVRASRSTYRIHVQELPPHQQASDVLLSYHRHLEESIRCHPEQWVWFHKRWRTLASGETLSSKQYLAYLESMIAKARAT